MSYIGNIPAEKYQTLQKQSFTTSATDTYTLSYSVTNPQDLALFINNVRQNPNDAYTVSGTTLTLSSAITSSDTMYAVFLGRAVETIAPATGSVTGNMMSYPLTNFSSTGIDDNATSTAVTIDSSENVGIGTTSPNKDGITKALTINSPVATNYSGLELSTADTLRTALISNSNGGYLYTATDIPLVFQTNNVERARFTSAGLHIGGTGSANALDDYEEGTFTPTYAASGGGGDQPTVSYGTQVGRYTKVGRLVTVFIAFNTNSASNLGGTSAHRLRIAGLPFNQDRGGSGISPATNWADLQNGVCISASSGTVLRLTGIEGGNTTVDLFTNDLRTTGDSNQMTFSYQYEIA